MLLNMLNISLLKQVYSYNVYVGIVFSHNNLVVSSLLDLIKKVTVI